VHATNPNEAEKELPKNFIKPCQRDAATFRYPGMVQTLSTILPKPSKSAANLASRPPLDLMLPRNVTANPPEHGRKPAKRARKQTDDRP
jgi:hypothetical protein